MLHAGDSEVDSDIFTGVSACNWEVDCVGPSLIGVVKTI